MALKISRKVVNDQIKIVNDVISGWKVHVLFALHNLKVFPYLHENPSLGSDIANDLGIPEASLTRTLDCAVSMGYLEKKADRYANSTAINHTIIPGAPGFLGNWLELADRWTDTFARLEHGIHSNKAVENVNFDEDEAYQSLFIKGMIDYANYRGRDILNHVDFTGASKLLDIGCGPAVYAVMFCQAYDSLAVDGLDLEHSLKFAKQYLSDTAMEDRVRLIAGNYRELADFGEGYDVVFLSHILHQETRDNCIELMSRCHRCLKPGGLAVIQAMFPNENGMNNDYAYLHDLLSLLIFPGGENHSPADTVAWMKSVGFKNVEHRNMSMLNINSLIMGQKPL